MISENLIEIKNLKKHFYIDRKMVLKAVDGISFNIKKGETFGLIGESGCGKTTCGRTILGLYKATSGEVFMDGTDIQKLHNRDKKNFAKKCQIIFQDTYSSLNPRITLRDIIGEGIDIHNIYRGNEREEKINRILEITGLDKAYGSMFPHEFSGGQRQRIVIARALSVEPEFIVCDEPVSSLDVSMQAQIINLLVKLQKELGLTYLFISHDLSVIRYISHRVGVMYLGHIVELGDKEDIYENPMHPYTKAMLSAIPNINKEAGHKVMLKGELETPINPKPGCRFANRCIHSKEICYTETPELKKKTNSHFVACHLY
ncbi:MAG: ABC transporter ATP-binding protein [Solirubrobacterales bacterium]